MTSNTVWIVQFCNGYAPLMVWLAKLFIYAGLVAGVIMAAAEAYKLYREARAIKPARDDDNANAPLAPAAGEIIKNLVGLLTGAKAWLALAILGVLLLWLAGNSIPEVCEPQQPQQQRQTPAAVPGGSDRPSTGAQTNANKQ